MEDKEPTFIKEGKRKNFRGEEVGTQKKRLPADEMGAPGAICPNMGGKW